ITYRAQMRPKFLVNLPVLSLGEEMQIDLAHDRPILIGVARELIRAIPFCDAQMIRRVPCRARDSRTEETFLFDSLRCDRLLRFTIQYDLDRARVRAKDANLQIVPYPMRPQHAERI